ncbi:hypothetical protein GBAR_LOCUS17872, partial [Geodia barretti]
TCVICCQSLNLAKDEALFCSGRCQQWLHRYCASVSVNAYQSIKADDSSFSCYDCYRRSKDEQLLLLEQSVLDLKAELAQLQSTPLVTGPEATHAAADPSRMAERSYASATSTVDVAMLYSPTPTILTNLSYRSNRCIMTLVSSCLPISDGLTIMNISWPSHTEFLVYFEECFPLFNAPGLKGFST